MQAKSETLKQRESKVSINRERRQNLRYASGARG